MSSVVLMCSCMLPSFLPSCKITGLCARLAGLRCVTDEWVSVCACVPLLLVETHLMDLQVQESQDYRDVATDGVQLFFKKKKTSIIAFSGHPVLLSLSRNET